MARFAIQIDDDQQQQRRVQPAGRLPPAALTIKVTTTVCDKPPLAPFTVKTLVPTGVDAEVVIDNVEVPDPLTEVGLKTAVAPVGSVTITEVSVLLSPLTALQQRLLELWDLPKDLYEQLTLRFSKPPPIMSES